jgi:aldose 1-epimerase
LAEPEAFRDTIDGSRVELYTLRNAAGTLITQITNYGGRVVNLYVADRDGVMGNVVLGFDSLTSYFAASERFYGALIGRYGNRINRGRFELDGTEYELATNNGQNHLHGGVKGFDRVVWDARQVDDQTLELTYVSPHMEEGYPGTLTARVQYRVTAGPTLEIRYHATTDAPTIVNLTHHSFFNLAGAGTGTINAHLLQIAADQYTPVDSGLIPTGEIARVEGTPMDFTTPMPIGSRLESDFEQLRFGQGYDHNWVLRPASGVRFAARVSDPASGRVMEVLTDRPGLQFYGGNFYDGSDTGASGQAHRFRESFALEAQHFPDSPNHPQFPSTVLRPGEVYEAVCVYAFSVVN